jgi:DNA-binding transcriptional MerR regulator/methylmalonyl-CoA mutase cobalamin-binding subunit
MYTIKEAAARTGLSVPVLRAWERRYGVVSPTRTPGGYRVYDDEALARLRSMRRLIAAGWSPSAAAAAVVAGQDIASMPEPDGGDNQQKALEGRPDGALANELLAASTDLAGDRIEAALDDMFAAGSYERVVEDHIVPALHAIGDGWADGRLAVAGEHVASNAIQRRLAAVFQASGSGGDGERPVLVGMAPGARHELGALIFATATRRAGLPALYLGADLPVAEWVAAVERTEPQAVVIGAVMRADSAPAAAVAHAIAAGRPGLVIAYGGPAAPAPGPSDASIRLPDDVREAVTALRSAIAGRSTA